MGWIIASILSGLMFIICGFAIATAPQGSGEANPANVFVTMLMLALCIVFFKKYRNSKNGVTERKKEERRKKVEKGMEKLKMIPGSKARINDLGASLCICAKHMTGLPLSEDTPCHIYLCADKIIFERNETKYNLLVDKINDVIIKTDKEIQKSYVSSVGGAVGGAVLFGPLGAMVGGRAKEKKSTTIHNYLIFTYDKEGVVDYISFDVTGIYNANKFVNFFKSRTRESKEVNL